MNKQLFLTLALISGSSLISGPGASTLKACTKNAEILEKNAKILEIIENKEKYLLKLSEKKPTNFSSQDQCLSLNMVDFVNHIEKITIRDLRNQIIEKAFQLFITIAKNLNKDPELDPIHKQNALFCLAKLSENINTPFKVKIFSNNIIPILDLMMEPQIYNFYTYCNLKDIFKNLLSELELNLELKSKIFETLEINPFNPDASMDAKAHLISLKTLCKEFLES